MMRILLAALLLLAAVCRVQAQDAPMQSVLQDNADLMVKSSRQTIGPVIDAVVASGLPQVQDVLQAWQAKEMWQRKADGLFFHGEKLDAKTYRLTDFDSGLPVGEFAKGDLKQLKPNSGVRALIGVALVKFQLSDPDPTKRRDALVSLERDPNGAALEALRASIAGETDPALLARKQRLERLLTMGYDTDPAARIAAMEEMAGDTGLDVRATLNPILQARLQVFDGEIPEAMNVLSRLEPGSDALPVTVAYDLLVEQGKAPALISHDDMRNILAENIDGGRVGGIPVAKLDTDPARRQAFATLVEQGLTEAATTEDEIESHLSDYIFAEVYAEPSRAVTDAAAMALESISTRVGIGQAVDLTLDALSLASIYFLAAIGLAITFGVMRVINMAHGEFIMMGAYTGYVVQQWVPNHTASIIVAIPLAFTVTFAAGVAMERLVIRWLYNRPLESLLATFGISIALQQLAKNIFGTQARPLTAPSWLDGAWVLNDVVAISYIRIAIFVLALFFLGVFLFIMRRTRLGLETRAVTQNPGMAASMGINPGRVNMLTFGLGSGIAGVAGVAIGLFAKVTSELGSDYIVQSFMTVVVGGVGNIWGALAGATMIGFMQKGIEWFNPSNTLAAQTFMIVFIIIFIQFRPRGIVALRGRAAGD